METLSLLGIHTDGEHLVLVDAKGERYLLPIEEELRSIVRQHRRKVAAALELKNPGSIRPKEIQSMIRAGATAEEVAAAAGVDLENVKRYEDPVISERIWIAQQAGETRVSSGSDAPKLQDLVLDRLATRGVSPDSLHWDATRQPGEEWVVHLEFIQDAKNYEANWEFDTENRILTALDEQSRWLTETATPAGSETLLRNSFFPASARDAAAPEPPSNSDSAGSMSSQPNSDQNSSALSSQLTKTEAILDELNAARGTRLTVVSGDEDDDISAMEAAIASGFNEDAPKSDTDKTTEHSSSVTSLKSRRSILSQAEDAEAKKASTTSLSAAKVAPHESTTQTSESTEATAEPAPGAEGMLPGMNQIPTAETKAEQPKRSRPGRAQMPSWDEIMFGTKSD